jgi:hypothetical protein
MDLPFVKFEQWTIETAQMKHTARKSTMSSVAQNVLRRKAAECGIEDYQTFLSAVQTDAEVYETLTEPEREFCDMATSVGAWAVICACVKPYISADEWLGFNDRTIEGLSEAAMELNPHWFAQPDQEKKTDEQPQIPTAE